MNGILGKERQPTKEIHFVLPGAMYKDPPNHQAETTASSPAYLVAILRTQGLVMRQAQPSSAYENNPGGDNSVFRRCRRHLQEIHRGLVAYTGSPLASRMAWDDCIRPNILRRGCCDVPKLPPINGGTIFGVSNSIKRWAPRKPVPIDGCDLR